MSCSIYATIRILRRILILLQNKRNDDDYLPYSDCKVIEGLLLQPPDDILAHLCLHENDLRWDSIPPLLQTHLLRGKSWSKNNFIQVVDNLQCYTVEISNWFNLFSFFTENTEKCLSCLTHGKLSSLSYTMQTNLVDFILNQCINFGKNGKEEYLIEWITKRYNKYADGYFNDDACLEILDGTQFIHSQGDKFLEGLIFQTQGILQRQRRYLVISKFLELKPFTSVFKLRKLFQPRKLYGNFRLLEMDENWMCMLLYDLERNLIALTVKEIRSLCSRLKKWLRVKKKRLAENELYKDFIKALLMEGVFYQLRIDRLCIEAYILTKDCISSLESEFDEIWNCFNYFTEFPTVITDLVMHYCNFSVCLHPKNKYILNSKYQKNTINVTPKIL
jgi:hypothetical protein